MAFSKHLNSKKGWNKREASLVIETDCVSAVSLTKSFLKKKKGKKPLNPQSFAYRSISARLQGFLKEIDSDLWDMHYIIVFF